MIKKKVVDFLNRFCGKDSCCGCDIESTVPVKKEKKKRKKKESDFPEMKYYISRSSKRKIVHILQDDVVEHGILMCSTPFSNDGTYTNTIPEGYSLCSKCVSRRGKQLNKK